MTKFKFYLILVSTIMTALALNYLIWPSSVHIQNPEDAVANSSTNADTKPAIDAQPVKRVNNEFLSYNLRLVGIIDAGTEKYALISIDDRDTDMFSVNSFITDGIVLTEIFNKHVILQKEQISWAIYLNHKNETNETDLITNRSTLHNSNKKQTSINRQKLRESWGQRNTNGDYVIGNIDTDITKIMFDIKPNDTILKVNGRPPNNAMINKLNRFLNQPIANKKIDVTVERTGETLHLTIAGPDQKK